MHSSLLRKRLHDICGSLTPNSDSSPTSSCPSTPPSSTVWFEPPAIDFCLMTKEHRPKVSDLITDTFFRDEPLNKCLAFDLPHEPTQFTELVLTIALEDQCSFVAIDLQTQNIIAVIINLIKHKDDERFAIENFQSEKLRFILGVLHHVHGNIDLFEKYHADHLLHVMIIAVDARYRGLRLTEKLIHASLERAKTELHLKAVFSEATSLYSAKAFLKQGFEVLDQMVYIQYDQTRLATLGGEHDRCQLLAKQL